MAISNKEALQRLESAEQQLDLAVPGIYRVIIHRDWEGTVEETDYPDERPGLHIVHVRYTHNWRSEQQPPALPSLQGNGRAQDTP